MQVNTQHAKETFSIWDRGRKIGEGATPAEARAAAGLPGVSKFVPPVGRRASSQGDTLLRVLLPSGAGPAGNYLSELSGDRLRPMFGCSGGSLRLSLGGVSLDVAATAHTVKRGDILKTVRPDRPEHRQEIAEDAIALEIDLPGGSPLAAMARKLAARGPIACGLSYRGERTGWKTCTSGRHFGEQVLRTSPEGIDEIRLGTPNGEEAHVAVIA